MREQLIRYLLGELDASDRQQVQALLQASPELQRELARLRSCFAAYQDDDYAAEGPSSGLAKRTAERVMGGEAACDIPAARPRAGLSSTGDPPAGILGWSLADLTVAGGVMLAVSMLIFPALRNSRDGTRLNVCQNNLHQIWVLGSTFAENHGRLYPKIGPSEHAGSYVAQLILTHSVQPDDLRLWLVCPGGEVAEAIRSKGLTLDIPTAEKLQAMTASQISRFTAKASPSYSYRLPYRSGGKLCYIQEEHKPLSPVFSDTAGDDDSDTLSPNHGGTIMQVQFDDGSSRTTMSPFLPGRADDNIFYNDMGEVAAGMRPLDAVLGNSSASPGRAAVVPAK